MTYFKQDESPPPKKNTIKTLFWGIFWSYISCAKTKFSYFNEGHHQIHLILLIFWSILPVLSNSNKIEHVLCRIPFNWKAMKINLKTIYILESTFSNPLEICYQYTLPIIIKNIHTFKGLYQWDFTFSPFHVILWEFFLFVFYGYLIQKWRFL